MPKVKTIIINTDSKMAIKQIQEASTDFGRAAHVILSKLMLLTSCTDAKFRHVKAHSGAKDARSKVNEWCDTEAKNYMRLHRKELNKK